MKKPVLQWQNQSGIMQHFIKTDVSDEGEVQNAVNKTVDTFGALHGAINCAGIAYGEKILSRRGPHRMSTFTKIIESISMEPSTSADCWRRP